MRRLPWWARVLLVAGGLTLALVIFTEWFYSGYEYPDLDTERGLAGLWFRLPPEVRFRLRPGSYRLPSDPPR